MKKLQFKKEFFIAFIVVLVFLTLLLSYFYQVNSVDIDNIQPKPTPSSLEAEYSNLKLITPGKSTLKDVLRINGGPNETAKEGDKTYLYYSTPFEEIKNRVLIKNDVVVYALEYVFADYRGTRSEYIKSFGEPDFVLYEHEDLFFPWHVFLKEGVMIRAAYEEITGIVYFIPQNREMFFKNIAEDLGFSTKNLEPADQAIFAPE